MHRLHLTSALAAAALLMAACGSTGTTATADLETAPPASAAPADTTSAPPADTAADADEAGAPQTEAVPATLKFTAKTLTGEQFKGESLTGKPVVFWFWAPWCPKCQSEAPAVKAAAAKYGDVAFVGVAGLDTEPAMKEFVQRSKTDTITHLSDEEGVVWTKLGVSQQSTFVFMKPDGSIEKASGPLKSDTLNGHIDKLLAG